MSEFHVIGGKSWEFTGHDSNLKKNKLIKVRIHPKYAKEKFIADVAVAKIKYPLNNKNVGYAQICRSDLSPNDTLIAAGWGFEGGIWDELKRKTFRMMKVSFVGMRDCQKKLGGKLPPNIICAGGYNNQTLCFGDSGGPLLLGLEVCGINTWTFECGNNAKPDVYMDVRYYASFIEETISDMGF
uniref:GG12075 n=2 Tax=Drosophila erecta TaxID=7220 RepID=B3P5U6_DROER